MTVLEKITRLSSELDRRKANVELVRELKQMLQTTGFCFFCFFFAKEPIREVIL